MIARESHTMNAQFKMPASICRDDRDRDRKTRKKILNEDWRSPEDSQFEADLIELQPFVRAYAQSLSRDSELADELTQDALLNAWRARSSYQRGTNLKGWLCIIVRNRFYSHLRRSWRQMPWDELSGERIVQNAEQASAVDLSDALRALELVPTPQREALTLIAGGGFSYSEAARICNCKEGTMKSRVARARSTLAYLLEGKMALPAPRQCEDAIEAFAAELASLAFGAGKVGLRVPPR
jgi:RNA polymerase sigma-70 factor (ECF subfamily)